MKRKPHFLKPINFRLWVSSQEIINAGFDDHLDVLVRTIEDEFLLQEIIKYKRPGDAEIIQERKRKEGLTAVNDIL